MEIQKYLYRGRFSRTNRLRR
jgi:hypothetical protein